MKTKNISRLYNFSDAELTAKSFEKIAFMRRDAAKFEAFGIDAEEISEFEQTAKAFSNLETDVEARNDLAEMTQKRDLKAEELRVAVRRLLLVAKQSFGEGSARHKSFMRGTLSKLKGAELVFAARLAARKGADFLPQLAAGGVSLATLSEIDALRDEFDNLFIEQLLKASDRLVLYEDRIVLGNSLYVALANYLSTGRLIWETVSPARYNDYKVYDSDKKKKHESGREND